MKRYLTTDLYHSKLLASLLFTGLLFSSSFAGKASSGANDELAQTGPTSFRSVTTLFRNYALTSFPGQRTVSDISKQNGIKRSLTYGGPELAETGAMPAATHQLLVTSDVSVLYLSFRLSRPGGRAPPFFA